MLFAVATEQHISTNTFARESLRESQRLRTSLSHVSIWVFLASGFFYLIFFGNTKSSGQVGIWVFLTLCGVVLRWSIALKERSNLINASARELVDGELNLFVSNAILAFLVGSGYWIVGWDGDGRSIQIVALVSSLFAIATVTNLSTSLRQFVVCLSLNMLQGLIFFVALKGEIDFVMVFTLMLTWVVLFYLGFRNAIWFHESMKMRSVIQQRNDELSSTSETLKKTLEQSIQTNASKSHFIGAASHDLRQPLHSMTLFLGILQDSELDKKQSELVANISLSADSLRSQFERLLELSKLEAGKISVRPREFDLYMLLVQIVERFEAGASKKNISISIDGERKIIQSDPVLIDRIVSNVVDNAIKYTEVGEVRVVFSQSVDNAHISIADTGIGIKEGDQKKVFEEYVQLNNPARRATGGAGMGLAIVKRLVELLGGKINLCSTPVKGTVVNLSFPLVAEQDVVLPAVSEVQTTCVVRDDSTEKNKSTPADLSDYKILVVDDNPGVLLAAKHYILMRNGKPFLSESIEGAKKILMEERISMAILDDMLAPGITGLDVAAHARRSVPQEKIIIISGLESAEREKTIREAGYALYKKPLEVDKLDAIMLSIMN